MDSRQCQVHLSFRAIGKPLKLATVQMTHGSRGLVLSCKHTHLPVTGLIGPAKKEHSPMNKQDCATQRRERLQERGAVAAIAALLSVNVAIAVASLLHL